MVFWDVESTRRCSIPLADDRYDSHLETLKKVTTAELEQEGSDDQEP